MAERGPDAAATVVARSADLAVLRAGNPGPMTLDGTRSYVLGAEAVVIVDPGPGGDAQLAALERLVDGRPVVAVLLTHAHGDHSELAARAARRFGADVAASAATLGRLGIDGEALADGAELHVGADLSIVALHTPGHSADHVCYIDSRRRLVSGDLVLGSGSSAILHPDGSVAACLASLARLISLRPRVLLPGHGPVVEPAMPRLEAYRRHRREREREIRAALAAGHRTVPEIRDAVYGPLPVGLVRAADASVAAHLAALAAAGEVDVPPFGEFGAAEDGDH